MVEIRLVITFFSPNIGYPFVKIQLFIRWISSFFCDWKAFENHNQEHESSKHNKQKKKNGPAVS